MGDNPQEKRDRTTQIIGFLGVIATIVVGILSYHLGVRNAQLSAMEKAILDFKSQSNTPLTDQNMNKMAAAIQSIRTLHGDNPNRSLEIALLMVPYTAIREKKFDVVRTLAEETFADTLREIDTIDDRNRIFNVWSHRTEKYKEIELTEGYLEAHRQALCEMARLSLRVKANVPSDENMRKMCTQTIREQFSSDRQ